MKKHVENVEEFVAHQFWGEVTVEEDGAGWRGKKRNRDGYVDDSHRRMNTTVGE